VEREDAVSIRGRLRWWGLGLGAVLAEVGGVRVEAARRLGIDRTTLYRLMRKYGI
jgi:transcriptional regulator of acetoin/glycerol metabolism